MFLLVLFAFTACQPNKTSQLETTQTAEQLKTSLDTIIFRTSSDQTIFVGKRIIPQPQISDSVAINFLKNSEIATAIEVGDTLFVFLNNNMLANGKNQHFPQVNDSLLQHFYPKMYEVEIDDDLPYFAYLRSEKDFVMLMKDRESGLFEWDVAAIGDTVLTFMNGIKIGMSKQNILEKLDISEYVNDKSDITIILYPASAPNDIWYKPFSDELRTYSNSTTTMMLRIKGNTLNLIMIDFWIGYNRTVDSRLESMVNLN